MQHDDFNDSKVIRSLFCRRINKSKDNIIGFIEHPKFALLGSTATDCGGADNELLTMFGNDTMECCLSNHNTLFHKIKNIAASEKMMTLMKTVTNQ